MPIPTIALNMFPPREHLADARLVRYPCTIKIKFMNFFQDVQSGLPGLHQLTTISSLTADWELHSRPHLVLRHMATSPEFLSSPQPHAPPGSGPVATKTQSEATSASLHGSGSSSSGSDSNPTGKVKRLSVWCVGSRGLVWNRVERGVAGCAGVVLRQQRRLLLRRRRARRSRPGGEAQGTANHPRPPTAPTHTRRPSSLPCAAQAAATLAVAAR